MFMHKSKNGFTIVELVIVIAVISILAAVLIPTFSNLVKKANIANDTALAKNINTALTAYEAINGKVDEFSDVIAAARDAGYIISNLNPTTEGCYFVWESDSNQILLVDGDNGYEVIYANNEKYTKAGNTWYFAVRTQAEAAAIKAAAGMADVNAKLAISKTSTLNTEINNITSGETVYIDGAIEVDDKNTIKLDKADADVTIDLGSSEVTGGSYNEALDAVPIKVEAGKLTLKNGVIAATGRFIDEDGYTTDIPFEAKKGTYTKIDGTVFNIETTNKGYLMFHNNADVENVTINTADCGINLNGADVVTIKNTTINSDDYCFFVSNWNGTNHTTEHSKLVIESGTYNAAKNNIEVYTGEATINGGSFTAENGFIIYFYLSGHKVTVTGGTFNGVSFDKITNWSTITNGNVTKNADGTVTITK